MGGEGEDGDEEPQEKVEEEELGEEEIDEEEHQEVDVAGTTPKKELQEKDADEEAKEKAEKHAEKDDGGHGGTGKPDTHGYKPQAQIPGADGSPQVLSQNEQATHWPFWQNYSFGL